jgi:tape measure domain-containing protein
LEEGERMSPGVEERVVSIRFDNTAFESRVASTLASIDKLNEKLGSLGAGKGFADINAQASKMDLSGMASGVEHIASKFSALGVIGFTAIQNITNSAIGFVKNFAKKDILDPIITGGTTRARNIEQAQFQFEGLGMNVKQAMDDALYAVKGTAYGLDEAAKAAAQYGASGVAAGTDMKTALRAISGTAALTGRSFGEMSQIFTSSAGTGKVTNQDFLQFATRGLNAAAAYAKQTGMTEAQVHELAREGKIDFMSFAKAMDTAFGAHSTEASKTYAGALENMHAALARLGASFMGPADTQQRDLFNALTPMIDKVNAALQPLIESFLKIKGIATGNLIKMIQGLDFSGLTKAMPNFGKAFENAFAGVQQLFGTIKEAFREIFPASTTSLILKLSEAILAFSEHLKMGGETADKVKSIFKGLFSILSIAWGILKGLALVLADVVKAIFPASKGLLTFGAGLGEGLTKLESWLVDGGKLHAFFAKLGDVIVKPIEWIRKLGSAISDFFSSKFPDRISGRFDSMAQGADRVQTVWSRLTTGLGKVIAVFETAASYIGQWFSELGKKLADSFSASDFNSVVDVLNVGLLGGIIIMLKKFIDGFKKIDITGGLFKSIKGTFDQLTSSLKTMQQQVKTKMLMEIAASVAILTISIVALSLIDSVALTKALVAISVGLSELVGTMAALSKFVGTGGSFKLLALAVALGALAVAVDILAIAISALGKLSWSELGKGLTGVAGGLAILIAAAYLMPSNPMLIFSAAGLLVMAGALLLLSKAVQSFAGMSWAAMGKGLVGVAVGMALIVAAMNLIPASGFIGAAGFLIMAVGLRLMADAVKAFAGFSWKDLGKGLVGIAGTLIIVAAAMNLMPVTLPITAAGMVILSIALMGMASAVKSMGKADMKTLAKGIGAFAAMLIILAAAMQVMQTSIVGAAALIIAAEAIKILGKVLQEVGKLSIAQLATGLGAIAIALALIGAAALVLEPVLPAMLGLGVALGLIGASFALFGAGAFLVATAFGIMATSAKAGMEGIIGALALLPKAAASIALFGVMLIVNWAEGILGALPALLKVLEAVLSQLMETLIKLIPELAKLITVLITAIVDIVNQNLPKLVQMGYNILIALMDGINNNMPTIVDKATQIIVNFADALSQNVDKLAQAAATIVTSFLAGIAAYEGDILAAGINIIVKLLLGITQDVSIIIQAIATVITTLLTSIAGAEQQIIDAGFQILTNLLLGITNNITSVIDTVTTIVTTLIQSLDNMATQIMDAGFRMLINIITGIGNNIVQVANAATNVIVNFIVALDNNSGRIITAGTQFIVHLIEGLGRNIGQIIEAGTQVIIHFIEGLGKNALQIANAGMETIAKFVEGLAQGIRAHSGELRGAGKDLAFAIADGMTGGLASKVGEVASKAKDMASSAFNAAKGFLGIHSPSTLFYGLGQDTAQGFANALGDDELAARSAADMADNIVTAFTDTLSQIPDSLANMDAFSPTITPVLDLTTVAAQSTGIADALGVSSLDASVSSAQAALISSSIAAGAAATAAQAGPTQVIFEQTINSPDPLSTNEIYRNTKSQIALAKEELSIA